MEIVNEYPPNYQLIKTWFDLKDYTPVFAYGSVIYNPHKLEIPEDLIFHESIHSTQQKAYSSPEFWWMKYCIDSHFRKEQEVEAYAGQLNFIRKHIPKAYEEALDDFASILSSSMYNLDISFHQARTAIRLSANNK